MFKNAAMRTKGILFCGAASIGLALAKPVFAAESRGSVGHHYGIIFLMFAIVLLAVKIGNLLVIYCQPIVIGELLAGIVLAIYGYLGWGLISKSATNEVICFLASFEALLLL